MDCPRPTRDRRPLTADKVVTALVAECQFLADSISSGSVIGTARPDLGESYRLFTYKRWVIVFRPIHDGIEIIRIVDGSRDFSRIFGE
jgi:plasmid stabilization system protein ParE